MPLEWNVDKTDLQRYLHQTVCKQPDEASIKAVIDGSIERAIDCLAENIQDHSLYFLVEWNEDTSSLTVVVTDDAKQKESPHKIVTDCSVAMTGRNKQSDKENEVDVEKIQYWVRDLLTTSAGFIRFSLVAIFSRGDRSKTVLL